MPASGDLHWKNCHAPVDNATVAAIEARLGVKFPSDYTECAKVHHGGYPEKNRFKYPHPSRGFVGSSLGRLLSLDLNLSGNIVETRTWLSEQLPEGIVPIADDGGGDFVVLDYRAGGPQSAPTIAYWMHEREGAESIRPLAQTFDDFLNMLQERPKLSE